VGKVIQAQLALKEQLARLASLAILAHKERQDQPGLKVTLELILQLRGLRGLKERQAQLELKVLMETLDQPGLKATRVPIRLSQAQQALKVRQAQQVLKAQQARLGLKAHKAIPVLTQMLLVRLGLKARKVIQALPEQPVDKEIPDLQDLLEQILMLQDRQVHKAQPAQLELKVLMETLDQPDLREILVLILQ